jgi:hypothetical protein
VPLEVDDAYRAVMISRSYAKVVAGDRGRYAAMRAPSLTVKQAGDQDSNVMTFGL